MSGRDAGDGGLAGMLRVVAVVVLLLLAGCASVVEVETRTPTPDPFAPGNEWRNDVDRDFDTAYSDFISADREDVREVEHEVMEYTNAHRANEGVEPLFYNAELSELNRWYARELANQSTLAHTNPQTNRDSSDRIRWAEYDCQLYAENLYSGPYRIGHPTASAAQIVAGWLYSDSHRKALMDPQFEVAGIGVFVDRDARMYAVMTFCGRLEIADRLNGWENASHRDGTLALPHEYAVNGTEYELPRKDWNIDDGNQPFERPDNATTTTTASAAASTARRPTTHVRYHR
jgi:uncharacterized protein YkwD